MKRKVVFTFLIVIFFLIALNLYNENTNKISWTKEEIDFMKDHPLISLAPDPNFAPIEFFDENGEFKGLVSEYVDYINNNTPLTIKILRYDNWNKIIKDIDDKKIDMLGGVSKSEKRKEFLLFSDSYLKVPNIIVSKKDKKLSNLDYTRLKIGAVNGSANYDLFKEKYPSANLIGVKNTKEGLEKVSFNQLDMMIGSVSQIDYYINKYKFRNLKAIEELDYTYPIHFAVRKDYEVLKQIINKTLAYMPNEKRNEFHNKWMISNTSEYFITKKLFIKVIIGVIFVLIIILFFNYLLKRKVNKRTKEITKLNKKLTKKVSKMEKTNHQIVLSMTHFIEIHDRYTNGHSKNVGFYTKMLAKKIGFNEQGQKEAYYSGLLHDLGKALITSDIINKDAPLTKKEKEIIKKHPVDSFMILKKIDEFSEISKNVLHHHEKWDGTGYPDGLKGEKIPIVSRMIAITDTYDALTTDRSYKNSINKNEAIKELRKYSNIQFDPKLVDEFIDIVKKDANEF
ncbi:MAG: HD domain-containing phosphohydrolase [Bacillota bacterium]